MKSSRVGWVTIFARLAAALACVSAAAVPAGAEEPALDAILRFEAEREGGAPTGWGGGPRETIHFDSTVVHGGLGAARLERDERSLSDFTSITKKIPVDFEGDSLELRGFLRTERVTEFAGLWMREDSRSGTLHFDNMRERGLRGTTGWTEYSIHLPVDPKARDLFFGVLVAGTGKVWVDDLQLLVDGRPIGEAPRRVIEKTILDTDHEFDAGSRITISSLTVNQVEHLAVLARVWGFLKYHHPRVARGELHWDYELFRVLPEVLGAADRDERNRVLSRWVEKLGVPEKCDPCAKAPMDVHLSPRLGWIEDAGLLGPGLSLQLRSIHANRFSGEEQFYVAQVPGVGNPDFERELPYPAQQPADPGYRILTLLRLWNIIEYWFPYRDQIDHDWPAVLHAFLPRFVAAESGPDFQLELLAFLAHIQDTHVRLPLGLDVLPPRGDCFWFSATRFVEDRPIVWAFANDSLGPASGFEIGDVIEALDGQPIDSLLAAWSAYYSASNEAARRAGLAVYLSRGACGEGEVTVRRGGELRTLTVARAAHDQPRRIPHDRPGETFQLLSPDVAYLKLSSVRAGDAADYVQRASGTQGLVIDIRNYPSDFMVFALGSRLVRETTPFARFTTGDLANPGSFSWTAPVELQPENPGYRGKIVILVDEVSISQSEYTAMAFRAAPGAVVVGSTTAGADGNVSPIPLPGGLVTMMSGIGVFYPDKTPTQRIGIVPDIVATPTIAGIREGRDEVLEAALRHILGPSADEGAIRRMARRPE
jgi:hypothetical protein